MQPKRTLRQKLMEKLSAATEASNVIQTQVLTVDRRTLAIEMLVKGCPGAYIDFFFLTHKDLIESERPSDAELIARGIDPERHEVHNNMSPEAMRLLREHLVQAEACQRAGDVEGVYAAWEKAAQYFVGTHEYKTGAYFYSKCLHVAASTGWVHGEMDANLNLGLVSEQLGRMEDAVSYHERHLQLARQHGTPGDREQAERNLLDLYARQADAAHARGDFAAEEHSLRQMALAATLAGNRSAEGDAALRMGQSLIRSGQLIEALESLRLVLDIARELGSVRREGAAHHLIGRCLDRLKRTDEAMASLDEFRRLSFLEAEGPGGKMEPDYAGVAEASCEMGHIRFRRGEFREAAVHFAEFYAMARRLGDVRRLQAAKINLGAARAMAMRGAFLGKVREDLGAVLAWKATREPFCGEDEFVPLTSATEDRTLREAMSVVDDA